MGIPEVDPTAPIGLGKRIITPLALSKAGKWTLMHVSCHIDPALVRVTRGRVSTLMVTPAVLLTTVGAKSGVERKVALLYFTDAGRVILMASNFGGTRHPAWYHNLNAHPEVTLYGGGYEGPFRAHEATGAEHERLWGLAKRFSEGYARYEQTTGGRTIPVMVLEPVG